MIFNKYIKAIMKLLLFFSVEFFTEIAMLII